MKFHPQLQLIRTHKADRLLYPLKSLFMCSDRHINNAQTASATRRRGGLNCASQQEGSVFKPCDQLMLFYVFTCSPCACMGFSTLASSQRPKMASCDINCLNWPQMQLSNHSPNTVDLYITSRMDASKIDVVHVPTLLKKLLILYILWISLPHMTFFATSII